MGSRKSSHRNLTVCSSYLYDAATLRRDSAEWNRWVSFSRFPAKPGKWLQPSSTNAGHEAARLCAETAEMDTGHSSCCSRQEQMVREKKEAKPVITTTFCIRECESAVGWKAALELDICSSSRHLYTLGVEVYAVLWTETFLKSLPALGRQFINMDIKFTASIICNKQQDQAAFFFFFPLVRYIDCLPVFCCCGPSPGSAFFC